MKVAVLGGGNGSLAAAADATLAGHEVRLWRRRAQDITLLTRAGSILTVRDAEGGHSAKPSLFTDDLPRALDGADLILCPVPATAHDDLARTISPHLQSGQVVFLPPGTLGSLIFARAAEEAGTANGVAFAETGTLPWLVRKHGDAEVVISTRAVRLPTGVYPLSERERALRVIGELFPGVIEDCGDVVSAALMNAGPIIHPPLIILNAGPLEHFASWDIHNEGTQPSIRRVTDGLDADRIAVREAFGYSAPHFPLADHYRDDGDMWMYDRKSRANLTSSGDWREKIDLVQHRYMIEDTKLGLSLLCSLADVAGIDVPVARALMTLGGSIVGEDFLQTGRPLGAAGLTGGTVAEVKTQAAGRSQ